uniref:NACHT domain-containing protein n=1 Tax=Bionectria ochroleuca TaxID=29856 RepID=A0A8H7NQQ7_BIOOC
MQALLITQIWVVTKANNLTQDPGFRNRDVDVQDFIANLEKGYTKIEDLLKRQAASTQDHITDQVGMAKRDISDYTKRLLDKMIDDEATKAQHGRLRQSFEFPDMNSRRNAILDPQDASFERVFFSYTNVINRKCSPETGEIDVVWQSFVDWLRSNQPLFWIQGKPGAGKSTLMKYIVNHKETQKLLDQWCPKCRILSHYFWKIGSTMENNIQGLYCSLIHQFIDENEKIITLILDYFPFAKKKTYVNDWSTPELDSVLNFILDSTEDRRPVCIFIDGLDEYQGKGGQKELSQRIRKFARYEQVKICVSSRPEERLLESFSTTPNLRLQELTRPDMESNIKERLGIFERSRKISPQTLNIITKLLIEKAEGVFLWLQLTIQSIENGIDNEDSDELLITRLQDIPSDIEDLYTDMWMRLNQDLNVYRESAALFFQFLIRFQELKNMGRLTSRDSSIELHLVSLFDIACWKDTSFQQRLLSMAHETSSDEIVRKCERAEKEIRTRCAGFLEVQPLRYSVKSQSNRVLGRVNFVHRTVHDFLVDTAAGQQILSYGKLSAVETLTQLTKSEFSMAEGFYNARLLKEHVSPRPSFLGYIVFYPDLYDAAMPLLHKAEASGAAEVLRLWEWWGLPSRNLQRQEPLVKAVPQLMSRCTDLTAAQAYVRLVPSEWNRPGTAHRTTALWEFGQASLRWDLDWRTTPPGLISRSSHKHHSPS